MFPLLADVDPSLSVAQAGSGRIGHVADSHIGRVEDFKVDDGAG